jgi:hypothetical protein
MEKGTFSFMPKRLGGCDRNESMNILDSVNFIRNWRSGKILRKK